MKNVEKIIRKAYLLSALYLVALGLFFTITSKVEPHFPVWFEMVLKISAGTAGLIVIFWAIPYFVTLTLQKKRPLKLPIIMAGAFQITGCLFALGWLIDVKLRTCDPWAVNYPGGSIPSHCTVDAKQIIGACFILPFLLSVVGLATGFVMQLFLSLYRRRAKKLG